MANIDIKKLYIKVTVSDYKNCLAAFQAVVGKTLDSFKVY